MSGSSDEEMGLCFREMCISSASTHRKNKKHSLGCKSQLQSQVAVPQSISRVISKANKHRIHPGP